MAVRASLTAVAQAARTFRSRTDRPARGKMRLTLFREKLTSATYSIVLPLSESGTQADDCSTAFASAFSIGARWSHWSAGVFFGPGSWQARTRASERAMGAKLAGGGLPSGAASSPLEEADAAASPDG